ncbi:MAG: 50S ribosomal protein L22 [Tepidisphaeraceae bacterium]
MKTAIHKHARIAPRKARLVMDLIRGRKVDDAIAVLQFSKKRAAVMISKVVKSAVANFNNAPENAGVREELIVAEARVDEGPTIKRFQPKDRGKAHSILKRTSHLVISVGEGVAVKEEETAGANA